MTRKELVRVKEEAVIPFSIAFFFHLFLVLCPILFLFARIFPISNPVNIRPRSLETPS